MSTGSHVKLIPVTWLNWYPINYLLTPINYLLVPPVSSWFNHVLEWGQALHLVSKCCCRNRRPRTVAEPPSANKIAGWPANRAAKKVGFQTSHVGQPHERRWMHPQHLSFWTRSLGKHMYLMIEPCFLSVKARETHVFFLVQVAKREKQRQKPGNKNMSNNKTNQKKTFVVTTIKC